MVIGGVFSTKANNTAVKGVLSIQQVVDSAVC